MSSRKRPFEEGGKGKEETASRPKKNRAVYVSGLPEDTTLDELVEYFSRYGVIMDDMFTGGPRIKMYENEEGNFKGEALIVFLREESADLASQLLDESPFRIGVIIRVQKATFEQNEKNDDDDNNNSSSNKDKPQEQEEERKRTFVIDKKQWKQHLQQMQRKLEWTVDDSIDPEEREALQAELRRREKYSRIVVLDRMFTAADTQQVGFALELKEEILEEAETLGEVTAVHVLEDLGLCTIKYRQKESALACLRVMNGRHFDGRRISARLYDGSFSLKEKKKEDEEEAERRLDRFGEWLEQEDDKLPEDESMVRGGKSKPQRGRARRFTSSRDPDAYVHSRPPRQEAGSGSETGSGSGSEDEGGSSSGGASSGSESSEFENSPPAASLDKKMEKLDIGKKKTAESESDDSEAETEETSAKNKASVSSKPSAPRELSRREREAIEKERARQHFLKIKEKEDAARLAVIKKRREEEAARHAAEQKAKDEAMFRRR